MDYRKLGQRIRETRISNKYTQEKLAELCEISPTFLSAIERGNKKLSVETLVRISSALEISVDRLLIDSINYNVEDNIQDMVNLSKMLSTSELKMATELLSLFIKYHVNGIKE
ncbi:MAG: helix-turn-helix domain-containing protein [Bacillota bacterium]